MLVRRGIVPETRFKRLEYGSTRAATKTSRLKEHSGMLAYVQELKGTKRRQQKGRRHGCPHRENTQRSISVGLAPKSTLEPHDRSRPWMPRPSMSRRWVAKIPAICLLLWTDLITDCKATSVHGDLPQHRTSSHSVPICCATHENP